MLSTSLTSPVSSCTTGACQQATTNQRLKAQGRLAQEHQSFGFVPQAGAMVLAAITAATLAAASIESQQDVSPSSAKMGVGVAGLGAAAAAALGGAPGLALAAVSTAAGVLAGRRNASIVDPSAKPGVQIASQSTVFSDTRQHSRFSAWA